MHHYFIPDGEKTEFALDYIYRPKTPKELEAWPGINWIMEMEDETELFREKLFDRMHLLGFTGTQADDKAAVHFLLTCCKNYGVTGLSRQTVGSWIKNGKVSHIPIARRNIYRLCFALKMDVNQTREFFLKAYLDRPFNCKDLFETVCFFCLNNGLPYSEVERLAEMLENAPKEASSRAPESTVWIESVIQSLKTEQELLDFWVQQSMAFGNKGATARKEIQALLKKCYGLAEERSKIMGGKTKMRTPDALLKEIYDYAARGTLNGEKLFNESIATSSFPELVKRNFPQRQQLQNILDGKATDESLRKALIVLHFYAFFAEDDLRNRSSFRYGKPAEYPFEDFQFSMDRLLEKCGYVKLYWRNPFDWMFGFCAMEDSPLEELQSIISTFFVKPKEFERTDAFKAFISRFQK